MFKVYFFEVDPRRCKYDPVTQELIVGYTLTNKKDRHVGVPEDLWYGLKEARYADDFYRDHIRGKYDWEQMK